MAKNIIFAIQQRRFEKAAEERTIGSLAVARKFQFMAEEQTALASKQLHLCEENLFKCK